MARTPKSAPLLLATVRQHVTLPRIVGDDSRTKNLKDDSHVRLLLHAVARFYFGRAFFFELMLTGIPKLLLEELERRDMSVATFAQLAALEGIRNASKTKLNEYFRGATPMPNETAVALWALMTEIRNYGDSTSTPIALTDAEKVKTILSQRREAEKLLAEIAEEMVQ